MAVLSAVITLGVLTNGKAAVAVAHRLRVAVALVAALLAVLAVMEPRQLFLALASLTRAAAVGMAITIQPPAVQVAVGIVQYLARKPVLQILEAAVLAAEQMDQVSSLAAPAS